MQAVKSKDTKPELALCKELSRRGLRYDKHERPLPRVRRTADVVFHIERVAVFVDGCYWHGCPEHWKPPRTNTDFWVAKIDRNRARDADTDRQLIAAGWAVVREYTHVEALLFADIVERAVLARRVKQAG